jgi:hypothetical protein
MHFIGIDYRISLLTAAAFHGSTHQAAMRFQVIVPRQLAAITTGRQHVDFIYQAPELFSLTNKREWLDHVKTDAGFATIAGLELTLIDVCRYYHRAAGINGFAQVVHDIGARANPRILSKAAANYENASVRRLGYLFDHFGYERQATSLFQYATKAKSLKPLDPSSKPIIPELAEPIEICHKWKIAINVTIEVDS